MSLPTEKTPRTLSLKNTPQRFSQVVQRMLKLNKHQRQQYLDALPDAMLEEYIALQTGVPRGTLADKMIAARRES